MDDSLPERSERFFKKHFNVREGRASYQAIAKRVAADTRIDGIHLFQLMGAMIIASIGLNLDSVEAIVGAMLICPIMGTVMGIAHGIATIDMRQLKLSLQGILVQIVVCVVTSTLYFLISPLSGLTSELVANSTPTIWDVTIAFIGGFVGALGLSRQQEPGVMLAGVAVATSLMPPLCATGFGLAHLNLVFAASALYEFLINIVFISFGAETVFVILLRLPLVRDLNSDGVVTELEDKQAEERSRVLRRRLVIGTLLFALPCIFYSANLVSATLEQDTAAASEQAIVHESSGSSVETNDSLAAEESTAGSDAAAGGVGATEGERSNLGALRCKYDSHSNCCLPKFV